MVLKGKIYLIGMPGSGKSFFGEILAKYLSYPLIDLDKEIESKEKKLITDIFSTKGEDYFRQIEAGLLRSISGQHERMVLSTGGGTPCFHEGIKFMNETGITVFLKTTKEVLNERLSEKSHRPLMRGDTEKRIDELLAKRIKYYQQAHISIDHRDPGLLITQLENL